MDILALLPFITFAYLVVLFLIAYFADRANERGRSLTANPYVYSLSLAVYCTAWTFYGSVGLFSNNGFEYITIYIGPTFAAFTWWFTLRKIIAISRSHNTTSIADFISTRYGKSGFVAGLVAVLLLVGLLPYIALQLKAITKTLNMLYFYKIRHPEGIELTSFYEDHAFYIALVLSVFGALFGARKLDVTERHDGMVFAIAFEAVIKLVAFLAVGIYITYVLFDGYGDIIMRGYAVEGIRKLYTIGETPTPSYFQWASLILLSGVAVMLLPRQFQIAVIENHDPGHVRKAVYLFPLYLFCINFFVPAIAIGGQLLGVPAADADTTVLLIPTTRGVELLSILVFIGGFSAATGMLIVETVALSTMAINHIASPFIVRLKLPFDLSFLLIHLKRLAILAIILLGYVYYKVIGETKLLVDIGLMSFCAVLQLAPATFLGIYWERASKAGAVAGIVAGFTVWLYTLFIPSLADAVPAFRDITTHGLFGLAFLKPSALFHLEGFDIWSHTIFWSLFANISCLISCSALFGQTDAEVETARSFVNIGRFKDADALAEAKHIARSPSPAEYIEFLAKLIGRPSAEKAVGGFLQEHGLGSYDILTSQQAMHLRLFVERRLAAHLGSATAKGIIDNYLHLYGTKIVEIFDIFHDISESLKESRESLAFRLKELSLLYSSLQQLLPSLDEDSVMKLTIDVFVRNFNADACAIVLMDSDGKLRIKHSHGISTATVTATEFESGPTSYAGMSFAEQRVISFEDIELAPMPLRISNLGDGSPVLSFAIAPIIVARKPMGVIFILNRTKQFFTDQFINFFQGIANQMGLALRNSQLYRDLADLNRQLEQKVAERTIELERKSLLLEEANRHLQEVDRLKSQFLATISHELRTPLNSVIGYAQLMLDEVDGAVTPDQREDLQRIERNAKHLLQLINDILDLSKIEAGRMELSLATVELGETVDQVFSMLAPLMEGKHVTMTAAIACRPLFLHADRQRLEQILINLLSNAIKFTDAGRIQVRCERKQAAGGEATAEISVSDTGIGIEPEHLAVIFEAFRQVGTDPDRKRSGTGLGLNITKRLVEMHGGSIWVESRPVEGTTMTFTMPVAGQPGDLASGTEEGSDGASESTDRR